MNNMYLLIYSSGEYDDRVEMPIGVANSLEEAQMLAHAIETREQPYFEKYLNSVFNNLLDDDREFSIDVLEVPVVSV